MEQNKKLFLIFLFIIAIVLILIYTNTNSIKSLSKKTYEPVENKQYIKQTTTKEIYEQEENKQSLIETTTKEIYAPKNVFIDLGANKGDSVYNFFGLNAKALGGKLETLVEKKLILNKKWIIYAFEANPVFDKNLTDMKSKMISLGHEIYLFNSTAAFTYDGTIDFYIDTVNSDKDFWGRLLLFTIITQVYFLLKIQILRF